MRISDWSSDVCSSDLRQAPPVRRVRHPDIFGDPGEARHVGLGVMDGVRAHEAFEGVGGIELLAERDRDRGRRRQLGVRADRSEEHTSELQSLMRISYAVFCLKKKTNQRHERRK